MGGARSALAGGPPRTQVVFRSPIEPSGARSDWAPKAPWGTEKEREEFEEYLRMVHSDKASPWGYSAAIVVRIGKDGPDPNGRDDWARYLKASRAASLTGGVVPQQLSEDAVQKVLEDWKWVTRQFPRFEPSLFEPFPLRDLWLAEMAKDSEGYSREARTSILRRMFLGWREHCFPDCPALAAYRIGPKYQAPVVPIARHYAGAGQVVHR
jgi:hypothetical protein